MTWPNAAISTTNLDAGNDLPRLARADLKEAVDKLNSIITTGINGEYVVMQFTGNVARPDSHIPGNFTWRPQMKVAYASSNSFVEFRANIRSNVAATSGYYFVLPIGRYEITNVPTAYSAPFAYGTSTLPYSINALPGVENDQVTAIPVIEMDTNQVDVVPTLNPDSGPSGSGVPNHLYVTANIVTAFGNGGGWLGDQLGDAENTNPTRKPGISFWKIRKIS